MKNLVLVYSRANYSTAKKIASDLGQAGYQFEHIVAPLDIAEGNLGHLVTNISKPMVLLISDNFLKSMTCMDKIAIWFQRIHNNGKVLPVIIPGEYKNSATNQIETIHTEFYKISNLIKYMDYWKEEYLEYRRQQRHASKDDLPEIQDKVRTINGISSGIGEFFQYLKIIIHYDYSNLSINHYRAFFQFMGDNQQYEIVDQTDVVVDKGPIGSNNGIAVDDKELTSQSLVDIIESSSEDIISENEALEDALYSDDNLVDLSEIEPIDKTEIPKKETNVNEDITAVIEEMKGDDEAPTTLESLVDSIVAEEKNYDHISLEDQFIDSSIAAMTVKSPEPEKPVERLSDIESIIETVEEEHEVAPPEHVEDIVEKNIEEAAYTLESVVDEIVEATTKPTIIEGTTENHPIDTDIDVEDLEIILDEADVANQLLTETTPVDEDLEALLSQHIDVKIEPIESAVEKETFIREQTVVEEEEEEIEEELDLSGLDATDAYLSQAYQSFEDEDWEEGLQILASGTEKFPTDADFRYQYALALAQYQHDFQGASQQLEIVLGHDQQHEDAYFLLAEISEMHKDYLSAKSYYEKVATLNPAYPEVFYRLGILLNHHSEGEEKQVAAYFKQAIKQNKRHTDALYRYGILMNEHFGKHWKAVKYFKKVLKIQPEHPFANYDLAILYHRLGDRALANIYYQKATDINPELKTPKNDSAFKYELSGNVEEANAPAFADGEEDQELAELKRDLERLEQKMSDLELPVEEMAPQSILDVETDPSNTSTVQEDLIAGYVSEIHHKKVAKPTYIPKPPVKRVLLTNANSPIGKVIARLLSVNGFQIILTDRQISGLEQLADSLKDHQATNLKTLAFDIRDIVSIQKAIAILPEKWKSIDILINTTNFSVDSNDEHASKFAYWNAMIDSNVKGLFNMIKSLSDEMVARQAGQIINVSVMGQHEQMHQSVNDAAQSALDSLMNAARETLKNDNIRVSQVITKNGGEIASHHAEQIAQTIYFVISQAEGMNITDLVIES